MRSYFTNTRPLDGVNSKGEYLCRFLIIYVWIVENKAKYLLLVQMISRSASRAAAATLPNYFPRTHPCPGFPKPGCRDVAIQPAVAQALSMPVALDPVAVAGINLIKSMILLSFPPHPGPLPKGRGRKKPLSWGQYC